MAVKLREVSTHYADAAGCDALFEVSEDALGVVGFIALHDLSAGPAFGGIRRREYPSLRAAVLDAVTLAEQMTLKTALAGLPVGGGKGAVLDRPGLDLEVAYAAMGEAVERLGGDYFAGPDTGTGPDEMASLRRATGFVNHVENVPGESTARGVVLAAEAALRHLGIAPAGAVAAVQGLGAVGHGVAAGLGALGIGLLVSDLDPDKARERAASLPGARVVTASALVTSPAVLLAPCALGPVVTRAALPHLAARIICGAANQQLEDTCLALELDEAGILYVPDFAANAGAVIEGVIRHLDGDGPGTRALIDAAIAAIGPRVASILEEASSSDCTPLEVALSRVGRPAPCA